MRSFPPIDVPTALQSFGARADVVNLDLNVGVISAQEPEHHALESGSRRFALLRCHIETIEQKLKQRRLALDRRRIESLTLQGVENELDHLPTQRIEL